LWAPGDFESRSASPSLTKAASASGVAEHVHTATQHTKAIAKAAAAELAPTDGASAQAHTTEDMMHDIAALIYKRNLKGKAPPQG
jgi:hypothetical protein